MSAPVKIPVGATRGKLITDVTVAELEAACEDVEARLCRDPKHTDNARQRKAFVGAARKLLQRRKFPTGTYETTEEANLALRDAAEVGWLLSPATQMARLLDGCALVITAFRADLVQDTFADDDEPSRRVPGKSLLDRVAHSLGVSWRAELCRRTDDQRSPYVRSFQAAGRVREFDLSYREIQAHGEVDLTANSALCRKLIARINDARRSTLEIERRRAYITSHADTCARLRAIRGLGFRESYLPTELERPFFCARLVFDGRSDNPATKAIFDQAVADAFVPAASALYGGPKKAAGER